MKHFFTTILIIVLTNSFVNAQCNYRYQQEIFSNVTVTSDIVFGSNVSYSGSTVSFKLDIYEPTGDTASSRPILIMAHGGSFLGGTKTDADVVAICQSFAKRGYVTCSYEYRLGMPGIPNASTATDAVYRAVQDAKAAVRFFRQDAATSNTYKIDPSQIFLGGSSAGAFIALHLAYLDKPFELPATIDTTVLGGMEGTSGNPGYSSKVKAIVNLCGALGDKTWIEQNDIPVCSMHGTQDGTVPYDHAMLSMINGLIPIMMVDGSSSLHPYALSQGVDSWYYQWEGADHVPYLSSQAYMDTTLNFVSDFLYHQLNSYVSVIDSVSYTQTITCINPNSGAIDLSLTGTGNSFLWSNGATTEDITNLSSGFYNVTVTNQSGCSYSPGTPFHIGQPQGPSATTSISNVTTTGGNNGSINLTVNNGQSPYTFLWSNGATTEDVANLTAGNYTVTVVDANGCSTTKNSIVSEVNGIVEIEIGGSKIFPNPAVDYLIVDLSSYSNLLNTIQLFDIYGKLIREYNDFSGAKLKIDRNEISTGSYFLRISNSENTTTGKIIFQ